MTQIGYKRRVEEKSLNNSQIVQKSIHEKV